MGELTRLVADGVTSDEVERTVTCTDGEINDYIAQNSAGNQAQRGYNALKATLGSLYGLQIDEAGPDVVSEGKRRNGATRGSVITLRTRSTTMTRMEARDLVKRIQVLPDAEQTRILSRVMQAEGKKVAWSEVEAIQQRMGKLDVDDEQFTREIVEAVREVRRERRRKSRS